MAAMRRHLRKHWKKYALATVTYLGSRTAAKRYREMCITRAYCFEAKQFSERRASFTDPVDIVYVFLNSSANKRDAKRQFMKYSAPLLHLSGVEVIVIESDYEGQAQTLLNYIQPSKTAAVIVAGGSGTLMEVVTGLLRKNNSTNIPIGVLPLGRENSFFRYHFGTSDSKTLPARQIGEATMNILRGNVQAVNALKLQPEKGKTLYALHSIDWGVVNNAEENKNSWRLFGMFRTFLSYVNTAVRKWPVGFRLDVSHENTSPVDCSINLKIPYDCHTEVNFFGLSSMNIHIDGTVLLESDIKGTIEHNDSQTLETVGFNIRMSDEENLRLSYLPETTPKLNFIKQGFSRSLFKDGRSDLVPEVLEFSDHLSITPHSSDQQWFCIDGEPFEALPLSVTIEKDRLNVFAPRK